MDCAQRLYLLKQWQETVTSYQEAVHGLVAAVKKDYPALQICARAARESSEEARRLLDKHEREHGCGPAAQ